MEIKSVIFNKFYLVYIAIIYVKLIIGMVFVIAINGWTFFFIFGYFSSIPMFPLFFLYFQKLCVEAKVREIGQQKIKSYFRCDINSKYVKLSDNVNRYITLNLCL